jgi:hypothetical protein
VRSGGGGGGGLGAQLAREAVGVEVHHWRPGRQAAPQPAGAAAGAVQRFAGAGVVPPADLVGLRVNIEGPGPGTVLRFGKSQHTVAVDASGSRKVMLRHRGSGGLQFTLLWAAALQALFAAAAAAAAGAAAAAAAGAAAPRRRRRRGGKRARVHAVGPGGAGRVPRLAPGHVLGARAARVRR